MASHYKLLFRGGIHADQHAAVVRPKLQAMLKASDAQMEMMFSGKPVTIKKSVDEATAERYFDAFFKIGAKLEMVEAAAPAEPAAERMPQASDATDAPAAADATATPKTTPKATPKTTPEAAVTNSAATVPTTENTQAPADTGAFQLADVGADLVSASERPAEVESTVATDHLSLANPGERLGSDSTETASETAAVDTSHLQLDQPGAQLGVSKPEPETDLIERVLDFELGEVGEILVESSPQVEPELPDLSHLQLESLPVTEAADEPG